MRQEQQSNFLCVLSVVGLISGCGDRQVDAYYYPDRSNLSAYKVEYNIGSVEACRDWVYSQAAENNDPQLTRGDYECGIGPGKKIGSLTIYDETVR